MTGEDLLRLLCVCVFLLGSLVLGVGVAGVAGALSTTRGWMSLVRAICHL